MSNPNDKPRASRGDGPSTVGKIMSDFIDKAGAERSKSDRTPDNKVTGAMAKGSRVLRSTEERLGEETINRKSIIARASNSVMQFPVYISQSLRIAEAHTIGKAFERVYASFVQNVIAQNPVITDLKKVNNLAFLRDYHTNIKESTEVTVRGIEAIFNEYCEPIDQFDTIMAESVINELKVEGGTITFMASQPNVLIGKESARLAHESLEGFRYLTEAPGSGPSRSTKTTVSTTREASKPTEISDSEIKDDIDAYLKNFSLKPDGDDGRDPDADLKVIKDHIIRKKKVVGKDGATYFAEPVKDENGKVVGQSIKKSEMTVKHSSINVDTVKNDTMRSAVDAPTMIRDTDIKKFNAMQPFQFTVKFRVDPVYDNTTVNGKPAEVLRAGTNYEQSYILGVKSVLHVIKTKDLAEDLRDIITGNKKGLQSVRYKTGEISWLKDYMLNLPSLKADAMKRLDDRRWLSTLKRLGEYEKLNGTLLKRPNDVINGSGSPIPNATMVLTRGDIERLKDETGVDLETISSARSLANRLFLIAVVIVDQTAGSFKVFFPDMDNDWDIQSLGSLDAEVAKIDNSPLMAEINRISRKG